MQSALVHRFIVWRLIAAPLVVAVWLAFALLAAVTAHAQTSPLAAVALVVSAAGACGLAVSELRAIGALASGARLHIAYAMASAGLRAGLGRNPTAAEVLRMVADGTERGAREEVQP